MRYSHYCKHDGERTLSIDELRPNEDKGATPIFIAMCPQCIAENNLNVEVHKVFGKNQLVINPNNSQSEEITSTIEKLHAEAQAFLPSQVE